MEDSYLFMSVCSPELRKPKKKKIEKRFGLCPPLLQNVLDQHISKNSRGPKSKEQGNLIHRGCKANWSVYSKQVRVFFFLKSID